MGFMTGVITGVAMTAGAAAWYLSRSGERFRSQYRVERTLGELGDQLEARSREIQATVNAQLADMRTKSRDAAAAADQGLDDARLDDAQASAAEAAAEIAASVEAKASKVRRKATPRSSG